jgi:hypothetical protein
MTTNGGVKAPLSLVIPEAPRKVPSFIPLSECRQRGEAGGMSLLSPVVIPERAANGGTHPEPTQ